MNLFTMVLLGLAALSLIGCAMVLLLIDKLSDWLESRELELAEDVEVEASIERVSEQKEGDI